MVKLTYDQAVILCMSYLLREKFTDADIARFLGTDEDYVKRHRGIASSVCRKVVSTRLQNRKIFALREITRKIVMKKGGCSTYELEKAGVTREALREEPIIIGCGEEDEDYEKRFVSNNFPDNAVAAEEFIRGEDTGFEWDWDDIDKEVQNPNNEQP